MNYVIGTFRGDGIEMELYRESDRIYTIAITLNDEDLELKHYTDLHSASTAFAKIVKANLI